MIHVIATIELVSGKRDAFLKEARQLVPKVHAEAGCIEYGPAIDVSTAIPAQSPVRDDIVTIIEKWSDLPALEAHLKAPHMIEYRTRVKDFVRAVRLQILQPA
ncbi:MAG: antibiotic biosynthesis monooxygenase [Verrucomicrobia bacterium]|nr:antibiotic biosynthesis monooxygenase [Verrucomicrobiota bacterium]